MTVVDAKIAAIRTEYTEMPGFPSFTQTLEDYFDRTIAELKLQVRAEVRAEILKAHSKLMMSDAGEAHFGLGLLEAAKIAATVR